MLVRSSQELPPISGIEQINAQNGTTKLTLDEATTPQDILYQLADNKIILEKFEIAIPSLDEIFIRVVESGRKSV